MKSFIFSALAIFGVLALAKSGVVFAPVPTNNGDAVTVVVTGDVMLGRTVENLGVTHGFDYPFLYAKNIFGGADFVFVNLEGPVPLAHEKTPAYSFRFSFLPESIRALRKAGVNVANLANNHTADFGEEGYSETVSVLKKEGIAATGHPLRVGKESVFETISHGRKLYFIGINDTYVPVDISKSGALIRNLKKDDADAFVMVAVHFGEEYKSASNERQRKLARSLVDAGADAVFGSHPHVVEEREMYRGKPIFYSLGNFIFDQYFSEEVQKGLAVRLTIGKEKTEYELLPIDLHKSQPKLAKDEKHLTFSVTNGNINL